MSYFGLAILLGALALTGCVNYSHNASPGFVNWLPAWGSFGQRQVGIVTAQTASTAKPAATFIVRFNNEPVLTDIGKTFRRDGAGAQAKFATWQANHPSVQGLVLVRASYSGELLLGLPKNDPLNRTPRQVLAALRTMDNLAYAETDEIAHPGTGN